MASIGWLVSNFGFPGVLCFMAWRVLAFFKPIVIEYLPYLKQMIFGHIQLMSTLESHAKTGAETLITIEDQQKTFTEIQKIHGIALVDIQTYIKRNGNSEVNSGR
jgi:predicted phosphatase